MIWYYILSVIAITIEGFSGFGSTAIALPFLALIIGMSPSVALLTFNSMVTGGVILAGQYRRVNRREYLIITLCILPLILPAVLLFSALAKFDLALKLILGASMTVIGARYVYWYYIKKQEPAPLNKPLQYASLAVGALLQGMFSTGGPFIVLYAANRLKDKGEFQATMSAVWLTVNTVSVVLRSIMLHMYTWDILLAAIKCLPLLLICIFIGMNLHDNMEESRFKRLVYIILLAGGLTSLAYGLVVLL